MRQRRRKSGARLCISLSVVVISASAPVLAQEQENSAGGYGVDVREILSRPDVWDRPTLGFYGTSGLLDMPGAQQMKDGDLSLSFGYFGGNLRTSFTFQFAPRLSGTFRYAVIDSFDGSINRYDRSFDLSYQIAREGITMPALTIGLRDFGGSGIYGSEFLAASKTFNRLRVTGGLGWGRLASEGGFTNPLGVLSSKFKTRPAQEQSIYNTGQLDAGNWFRGEAAVFGGLQYQAGEHWVYTLEYSSDAYTAETERTDFKVDSPLNFGVTYRFRNGNDLTLAYMYGNTLGLLFSTTINGKTAKFPGGLEAAGPALLPRDREAALGWDGSGQDSPRDQLRGRVEAGMRSQGLTLDALEQTSATSVTVHVGNPTYPAAPEAIGRAARILANTLPPVVETFTIVPVQNGMSLSAVSLRRSDLEDLEFALDGSWKMYSRAQITDAAAVAMPASSRLPDAYPSFSYGLGTYIEPSYFDPDNPIRADAGLQFDTAFIPSPGLVLSSTLRYPVVGNLDEVTRTSNSVLPHVRSDAGLYAKESDLQLRHLTGEYFFRPGPDLYGRFTAGYLEAMYAGVSSEVLWKPVSSPLALGLEVNYAVQRDYDMLFGLRDYKITTGHASVYYEFGDGFIGEVDAGRYLAGDWGATVSLDREFANGFRVGAFFTKTDISSKEFGEGSFDKGIRFWIPLSHMSGDASKAGFGQTIRPLTRDGGARLNIRNRLYEVVRGYGDPELKADWGKFWR